MPQESSSRNPRFLRPVKTSYRCPKCASTDIRYELYRIDHVKPTEVGDLAVITPRLVALRLYDAHICAGCGFTEF